MCGRPAREGASGNVDSSPADVLEAFRRRWHSRLRSPQRQSPARAEPQAECPLTSQDQGDSEQQRHVLGQEAAARTEVGETVGVEVDEQRAGSSTALPGFLVDIEPSDEDEDEDGEVEAGPAPANASPCRASPAAASSLSPHRASPARSSLHRTSPVPSSGGGAECRRSPSQVPSPVAIVRKRASREQSSPDPSPKREVLCAFKSHRQGAPPKAILRRRRSPRRDSPARSSPAPSQQSSEAARGSSEEHGRQRSAERVRAARFPERKRKRHRARSQNSHSQGQSHRESRDRCKRRRKRRGKVPEERSPVTARSNSPPLLPSVASAAAMSEEEPERWVAASRSPSPVQRKLMPQVLERQQSLSAARESDSASPLPRKPVGGDHEERAHPQNLTTAPKRRKLRRIPRRLPGDLSQTASRQVAATPSHPVSEAVSDGARLDTGPKPRDEQGAVAAPEGHFEVELNRRRAAALRAFGLASQGAKQETGGELEAQKRQAALMAFSIRRG